MSVLTALMKKQSTTRAEQHSHPLTSQVAKWITLILAVFGAAIGYGSLRTTVHADSVVIQAQAIKIEGLQDRTARIEEAMKALPEIQKDVKELLKRSR